MGQAWMRLMLRRLPDIIIFENVKPYPQELLEETLGCHYSMQSAILDPRQMSIPMARQRLYVILYLKRLRWTGSGQGFLHLVPALHGPQMQVGAPVFATDPDQDSHREATGSEAKHLKQYVQSHQYKDRLPSVLDLRQSLQRPVHALKDNSLCCLRTTSTSLYLPETKQFLSGRQLLRAMGYPVTKEDARAYGLPPPSEDLPACVRNTDLCRMAGNGMCVANMTAALLVAVMFCVEH